MKKRSDEKAYSIGFGAFKNLDNMNQKNNYY